MTDLEKQAIASHGRGETWATFWEKHGDEARAEVPWNRRKFHRLFRKLLHLQSCGETSGMLGVGDHPEPWQRDDLAEQDRVDDTVTAARLQTNFPFFNSEVSR